jgi:hypothetical protein
VAELRADRIRKEAAIEVKRVLKVKADREAAEAVRATQAKADREAAASKAKGATADTDADKHMMESNDKEVESEEESDGKEANDTIDNWTDTEVPEEMLVKRR